MCTSLVYQCNYFSPFTDYLLILIPSWMIKFMISFIHSVYTEIAPDLQIIWDADSTDNGSLVLDSTVSSTLDRMAGHSGAYNCHLKCKLKLLYCRTTLQVDKL